MVCRGSRPDERCLSRSLSESAARIAKVIEAEEKQFERVLRQGLSKLDETLEGPMKKALDYFTNLLGHQQLLRQIYDGYAESRMVPFDLHPLRRNHEALVRSNYISTLSLEEREGCIAVLEGPEAFHLYETFGLRKISFENVVAMPASSSTKPALKPPAPRSRPAPAPVGKAAARRPPALPIANSRRLISSATSSSTPPTPKCSPS